MGAEPNYPELTEQELALKEMVRDFCEKVARPQSLVYEEKGEDPAPVYKQLAELGLTGIPFDPEFGGGGEPYRTYLLVIEELAKSWVSLAIGLGVHTLACDGLQRYGADALKKELLPKMLSGEMLGAYALSEPSSGSDAASLQTKAQRGDGHYLVNGQKQFCTRGGEADQLLLMARTGEPGPRGITAFIVEKGSEGFRATKAENKMGWRSSPTWELVFENCKVPEERLLGEEGIGFKIALTALDAGRLGIAACATGLAQAALEASLKFASEREQFDKPIIQFQGLQFMLADMATHIEAGRALYRHAASLKDAGRPYSREASMAKLFCTDTAMRVTIDAVQIHGGYGYIEEYPVERYMREAKGLQIVEGTNQIQRMVIGRALSSN
ncbi:MAG TPA: acyl-CoA dehydrogenase family protein [Actinomycetota bacterium]|nr:acyl-CoA dehydrogenase family protein [Actinomycetota bacterium]